MNDLLSDLVYAAIRIMDLPWDDESVPELASAMKEVRGEFTKVLERHKGEVIK